MGGQCLGPRRRTNEVYMKLIDNIHEQALKLTYSSNLDIYECIRDKINKKGLLHKLQDNLLCHRNNIRASLIYNMQIVVQSHQIQNKYAGLLSADKIVLGIYKNINPSNPIDPGKNHLKQWESSFNDHILINMSQIYQKKELTLKDNLQIGVMRSLFYHLDLQYFKLVLFLFQNQAKMYHRLLTSIYQYCYIRKQNFTCQEQIKKLLGIIKIHLDHLKLNNKNINNTTNKKINRDQGETFKQLLQNIICYYMLLKHINDCFTDDNRDENKLLLFINLWLQFKHSQKQQNYKNKEPQMQEKLIEHLTSIISLYFNRCLTSWQSQYLYHIIFMIADEHYFRNEQIGSFLTMVHVIVQQHDLTRQFSRGLLIHMLEYLSMTNKHGNSSTFKVKVLRKASLNSNINYDNIYSIENKINAMKLINVWIKQHYVDINQTITYNCNTLLNAYTNNLNCNSKDKKAQNFLNNILHQFLSMCIHLDIKSVRMVLNILFDQVRIGKWQNQEQLLCILDLIQKIIVIHPTIFHSLPDNYNFILCPEQQNSEIIKFQYLKICNCFLQYLSIDSLNAQHVTRRHNLCQLLYSITIILQIKFTNLIIQHNIIQLCIKIFRNLCKHGCIVILLGWLVKLNQVIQLITLPEQNLFMLYYLMLHFKSIIISSKYQSILKTMNNIVNQYTNRNVKQFNQQISKYFAQNKKKHEIKREQLNLLKIKTITSEQEYQSISLIFDHYWGNQQKIQNNQIYQNLNDRGQKMLMRRNSVQSNSNEDRGRGSSIAENSFREILDILHM